MRKTSYVVTFVAVALILFLNILSARRPDWLIVQSPEFLHTKVTIRYGLMQRCERQVISIPAPTNGGRISYTEYSCRDFPARVADGCEKENRAFCTFWTTAGYFTELAAGFASITLFSILIGVSTHSRRRRIWRAIAAFLMLQAIFQIVAFGIVTEMYRTSQFPTFEQARPGTGYVLNVLSWILAVVTAVGVITTGISADKGHRWAAGNRAYQPIQG